MTHETFESVMQEQLTLCTDILCKKSKEYSSQEDKLHNFKNAAGLQGVTQIQALSGMMAKHTISIYDMCTSDKTFPVALWEEKITDSINYLLLLKAAVIEEQDKPTTEKTSSVHISQAEYEELFAVDEEPIKTDYSKWTDIELHDAICKKHGASKDGCESCPLFEPSHGWQSDSCTNFKGFREVAIGVLEEHEN